MNPIGNEQYTPPNGIASRYESSSSDFSAQSGQSGASTQSTQGQQSKQSKQSELGQFAQRVRDIPYIVPVAIGGAAFLLGVLASSKILRTAVMLAGTYALKYAVQNAPKQEMMDYAKKIVVDAIKHPHSA